MNNKKTGNGNILKVAEFGSILIFVCCIIALNVIVLSKTNHIAMQQQKMVVQIREGEKKRIVREKKEVEKEKKSSATKQADYISQKEFERFQKDYRRQVGNLKREIRRIKALL